MATAFALASEFDDAPTRVAKHERLTPLIAERAADAIDRTSFRAWKRALQTTRTEETHMAKPTLKSIAKTAETTFEDAAARAEAAGACPVKVARRADDARGLMKARKWTEAAAEFARATMVLEYVESLYQKVTDEDLFDLVRELAETAAHHPIYAAKWQKAEVACALIKAAGLVRSEVPEGTPAEEALHLQMQFELEDIVKLECDGAVPPIAAAAVTRAKAFARGKAWAESAAAWDEARRALGTRRVAA